MGFTVLDQIENSNNGNGYLSNERTGSWKSLDEELDLDPDLSRFWIRVLEKLEHFGIRFVFLDQIENSNIIEMDIFQCKWNRIMESSGSRIGSGSRFEQILDASFGKVRLSRNRL